MPAITLAKIKKKLNEEQPGSVKGMGIYQITAIKYNGQEVEGTLKVPDDGEITLQVETDTVSEDSKFYGLILGKYYEIILENSEIKLGEEKSLSEIEDGVISSELIATLEKATGATTDVDIEISQDEITVKGKGPNIGRGIGTIKISYGTETRNVGIEVVQTFIVTVQAEKDENNNYKGTIIKPLSETLKCANGDIIRLEVVASAGFQFKDWYDGAKILSSEEIYDYTVNGNKTITARCDIKRKYGSTVNLGTIVVNNVALEKAWKYFYEDSANIYLKYAGYLENVQIPTLTPISKSSDGVWVSSSGFNTRNNFLEYLSGTGIHRETWKPLNDAMKSAVKSKLISNGVAEEKAEIIIGGVLTKGAPTPEQWINSYNENYGMVLGTRSFSAGKTTFFSNDVSGNFDGRTSSSPASGYLFTRDVTADDVKWEYNLPNGYMDKLQGYPGYGGSNVYYPLTYYYEGCSSYWLAGPSANETYSPYRSLCVVEYSGRIKNNAYLDTGVALSPVVSIPKSETIDIKSVLGID